MSPLRLGLTVLVLFNLAFVQITDAVEMKFLGPMYLMALAAPGVGAPHPADGPDVDVRIRIGSDAVVCTLLMNLAFIDEVVDEVVRVYRDGRERPARGPAASVVPRLRRSGSGGLR